MQVSPATAVAVGSMGLLGLIAFRAAYYKPKTGKNQSPSVYDRDTNVTSKMLGTTQLPPGEVVLYSAQDLRLDPIFVESRDLTFWPR